MSLKEDGADIQTGTMRLVDKSQKVSRRAFLRGGGLAAIGVTVLPGATLMLSPVELFAQSFTTLGPDSGKALVRMARDIFPHDKLSDKYYIVAVEPYDSAAAKDPATKKLITEGIGALNASANKRYGKNYVDVPTEQERVVLLKEIESTPFFLKVKGGLVTGLYNNKAVWAQFGYEGSSWEKGGYLNRGFNDLDWL